MPSLREGEFKQAIIGWSIAFGLTVLILLIGVLPPFVDEPIRGYLMAALKPFCHQIPSRSFHVDGVQLAVCHRCLGIYAGLPIAVVGFLLLRRWNGFLSRKAKLVLFASLMPLALDWILNFLGIWSNTAASRMATGGIFGLTAGYYLAVGIVNIGPPSTKRDDSAGGTKEGNGSPGTASPGVSGSKSKTKELKNA